MTRPNVAPIAALWARSHHSSHRLARSSSRHRQARVVAATLALLGTTSAAWAADKWHPGIYMGDGAGGPDKPRPQVHRIDGNPNYVGVRRVYNWKHVEPAEGQYDFSFILDDYQAVAEAGLYFGVSVRGAAYGGVPNVPDYILDDPSYGGAITGEHGICTSATNPLYTFPAIWRPAVRERLEALATELAQVLDELPNVAWVSTLGETATGAKGCDGWSCQDELSAYQSLAGHLELVFVRTPVLASVNFACYDIPTEMVPFLADRCIGMGPPNIKPDNTLLYGNVYEPMQLLHDEMPMQVNLDAYNDLHSSTPAELFAFTESSVQPHFLNVTLTNAANRDEIMADLDAWMADLGGEWPWQQPPSCIDEPPPACADAGGSCCAAGAVCEGGSFIHSADCGQQCCQTGVCVDDTGSGGAGGDTSGGSGGDAGAGEPPAPSAESDASDVGCGCTVVSPRERGSFVAALALFLALVRRRRQTHPDRL